MYQPKGNTKTLLLLKFNATFIHLKLALQGKTSHLRIMVESSNKFPDIWVFSLPYIIGKVRFEGFQTAVMVCQTGVGLAGNK